MVREERRDHPRARKKAKLYGKRRKRKRPTWISRSCRATILNQSLHGAPLRINGKNKKNSIITDNIRPISNGGLNGSLSTCIGEILPLFPIKRKGKKKYEVGKWKQVKEIIFFYSLVLVENKKKNISVRKTLERKRKTSEASERNHFLLFLWSE